LPSRLDRRPLARLAILFPLSFVLYIALQILPRWAEPKGADPASHDLWTIASALLLCAVMLAVYLAAVRWLEGRRAGELASVPGAAVFLAGLALGAALFCVVFALLAFAGGARLGPWQGAAGVAPALALALAAAIGEEIIFRGVLFRLVEESAGTTVAVAISAVLFGLVHSLAPGATPVSTLAIALEAGVLLALAFAAARNLWAPIGLHLGWNFTEGGVFGQAVSGGHTHGLFASTLTGGPLVTGGAFGPEASLTAMAVSLLASAALAAIVLRRGEWRVRRRHPA
jgi:hypothetical protein